MELLKKVLAINFTSTKTDELYELLKGEIGGLFDKSDRDDLGNIFFTKKVGEGKRLMLCTSCDVSSLIASYIDKSKIYVSNVGYINTMSLAFSRVNFGAVQGVLVPKGSYTKDTPLSDFYVETGDETASDLVNPGDVGVLEIQSNILPDGSVYGFASATKMCTYTQIMLSKALLDDKDSFLVDKGIGEICVCFMCQEALGFRGAAVACHGFNPDMIIKISPVDVCEKNTEEISFDKTFYIKMLDKSFVASPETAELCVDMCKHLGIETKKFLSHNCVSGMNNLSNGCEGAKMCQVCIAVKHVSYSGECVKGVF